MIDIIKRTRSCSRYLSRYETTFSSIEWDRGNRLLNHIRTCLINDNDLLIEVYLLSLEQLVRNNRTSRLLNHFGQSGSKSSFFPRDSKP
jgi:hypothetical protein